MSFEKSFGSAIAIALVACGGSVDGHGTDSVPSDGGDGATTTVVAPPASGAACTVDDDCTTVFSGDVCTCACTYGAIPASEAEAYERRLEAARARCSERVLCGPCPAPPKAACGGGACGIPR